MWKKPEIKSFNETEILKNVELKATYGLVRS